MKSHDIEGIRERFAALTQRANESLGTFNEDSVGIGRYLQGSSPWEKHENGDELLFVADGEVRIEVIEDDDSAAVERLCTGALFVVPRGKWHQLTTADNATILYVSPGEAGAARQRVRPSLGRA